MSNDAKGAKPIYSSNAFRKPALEYSHGDRDVLLIIHPAYCLAICSNHKLAIAKAKANYDQGPLAGFPAHTAGWDRKSNGSAHSADHQENNETKEEEEKEEEEEDEEVRLVLSRKERTRISILRQVVFVRPCFVPCRRPPRRL